MTGPVLKNKLFFFFAYETIRNSSVSTGNGWYDTPTLFKQAPSGSLASRYGAYPGEAPSAASVVDQSCGSVGLIDAATATQLIQDKALLSTSGSPLYTGGANCQMIPGQGLDIGSPLTLPLGKPDPSQMSGVTVTDPVTKKVFCLPGLGGNGTGSPSNLDGIADIAFINTFGPNDATNQQYMGRMDFNATSKDLISYNIYYTPVDTTSFNGARPANLFHHSAINEARTGLWTHTPELGLLDLLFITWATQP